MSSNIKFNVNDSRIPLALRLSYSFDSSHLNNYLAEALNKKKKDGYEIANSTFLDLEIGKKYYLLRNNSVTAFKVLAVSFISSSVLYDIVFPANTEGYIAGNYIDANSTACPFRIFETKEDFMRYKETRSENFIYSKTTTTYDKLNRFKELKLISFVSIKENGFDRKYVKPIAYSMDAYTNPYRLSTDEIKINKFWIDGNGLHFDISNKNDRDMFLSREECESSFMFKDFIEDIKVPTDNTAKLVDVTITIPVDTLIDTLYYLTNKGIKYTYKGINK